MKNEEVQNQQVAPSTDEFIRTTAGTTKFRIRVEPKPHPNQDAAHEIVAKVALRDILKRGVVLEKSTPE